MYKGYYIANVFEKGSHHFIIYPSRFLKIPIGKTIFASKAIDIIESFIQFQIDQQFGLLNWDGGPC